MRPNNVKSRMRLDQPVSWKSRNKNIRRVNLHSKSRLTPNNLNSLTGPHNAKNLMRLHNPKSQVDPDSEKGRMVPANTKSRRSRMSHWICANLLRPQ